MCRSHVWGKELSRLALPSWREIRVIVIHLMPASLNSPQCHERTLQQQCQSVHSKTPNKAIPSEKYWICKHILAYYKDKIRFVAWISRETATMRWIMLVEIFSRRKTNRALFNENDEFESSGLSRLRFYLRVEWRWFEENSIVNSQRFRLHATILWF